MGKTIIEAVILDVDGTLVDAFGDIVEATNAGLRAVGWEPKPKEEIVKYVGYGAAQLVAGVMGLPSDSDVVQETLRVLVKHYLDHTGEKASLYPGARELLAFLRDHNVRTGVLSNKPHELTVKTLQVLGVYDLFDAVRGDSDGFPLKPDPVSLEMLCARIGARPQATIMLGDGDTDMEVAESAGAIPWGVTYGMRTAEELKAHGAVALFDSLWEVRDRIQNTEFRIQNSELRIKNSELRIKN